MRYQAESLHNGMMVCIALFLFNRPVRFQGLAVYSFLLFYMGIFQAQRAFCEIIVAFEVTGEVVDVSQLFVSTNREHHVCKMVATVLLSYLQVSNGCVKRVDVEVVEVHFQICFCLDAIRCVLNTTDIQ